MYRLLHLSVLARGNLKDTRTLPIIMTPTWSVDHALLRLSRESIRQASNSRTIRNPGFKRHVQNAATYSLTLCSILRFQFSNVNRVHLNNCILNISHRRYLVMLLSRLFLLLPSLIAASALPSMPALALTPALPVNSNSSLGETVQCYTPPSGYSVITIHDCIRAVNLIRQVPLYKLPQRWSAPLSRGRIIEHWTWGECAVVLFPRSPSAEDVFSLAEVLDKAISILQNCVAMHDKRGGRMKVGPEQVFGVGVRERMGWAGR